MHLFMVCVLVDSFIHLTFIELSPGSRNNSRCQGYGSEQGRESMAAECEWEATNK